MKKILAILGLACLASCASHQVANNVSLITFDDKVESAKSIGNVEGKDCTWSAFGYNLGDDPSVLRAFDNAANQRKGSFIPGQQMTDGQALKMVKNVSVDRSGFSAWIIGRSCFVVTGVGFR